MGAVLMTTAGYMGAVSVVTTVKWITHTHTHSVSLSHTHAHTLSHTYTHTLTLTHTLAVQF